MHGVLQRELLEEEGSVPLVNFPLHKSLDSQLQGTGTEVALAAHSVVIGKRIVHPERKILSLITRAEKFIAFATILRYEKTWFFNLISKYALNLSE